MFALLALFGADAIWLPNYSLRQSLAEARTVVPNERTRESWFLRCAGEAGAPAGLQVTAPERAAGIQRCWPTELIDGREQRSAVPRRKGGCATQEIELIDGRIVRIRIDPCTPAIPSRSSIWSTPEAAEIDRLAGGAR